MKVLPQVWLPVRKHSKIFRNEAWVKTCPQNANQMRIRRRGFRGFGRLKLTRACKSQQLFGVVYHGTDVIHEAKFSRTLFKILVFRVFYRQNKGMIVKITLENNL